MWLLKNDLTIAIELGSIKERKEYLTINNQR
jgi:hypothetical protein